MTALDVELLREAIHRASETHGSYDWDWVLEREAIEAIAREYAAPTPRSGRDAAFPRHGPSGALGRSGLARG